MTISYPNFAQATLPETTIVPDPDNKELFIPWLTRLYEDIAIVVNQKDWLAFTIPVADQSHPTVIPNIPNQGSFIICISGVSDGMPGCTYSLIKSISTAAGNPSMIQTQAGSTFNDITSWNGVKLIITSNANNFLISHDGATGLIGNFNIRFIGTT